MNKACNIISYESDFESVYMTYYNELYRFAYHYIMSDDAADLVQEVFLQVYNDDSFLSAKFNARAYLYKMVKNSCIDYLKHLSVRTKHQSAIIDTFLNDLEYDEEQEKDMNSKIESCLDSLPMMQREIIKLRLEGRNYNEIAQLLNISVGTINTHVSRAYSFIKNNFVEVYVSLIAIDDIFFTN